MNKDCFAREGARCGILKVIRCNKPCSFYKTKEQLTAERQKAYNRLMELGRLDLIDTYQVQAE